MKRSAKTLVIGIFSLILYFSCQISAVAEAPAATNSMIVLYAEPKEGKVLKKIEPAQRLISIIKQGDWVKVADPRDGQVGWVNVKQYQAARESYFRPNIQTIYVQTTQDKQGKPTVNIVAYKNGEQVSPAEAKKLYDQMREDQKNQLKRMRDFSQSMRRMMDRDFYTFENAFDRSWEDAWGEPATKLLPATPNKPEKAESSAKTQAPTKVTK